MFSGTRHNFIDDSALYTGRFPARAELLRYMRSWQVHFVLADVKKVARHGPRLEQRDQFLHCIDRGLRSRFDIERNEDLVQVNLAVV